MVSTLVDKIVYFVRPYVGLLIFSVNWPRNRFSLVVPMSVCVSVPLRVIIEYVQSASVLVLCHKIDNISVVLHILNF